MSRKQLLLAGVGLYTSIAGTTFLYFRARKASTDAQNTGLPTSGAKFDCIASSYDKSVGWDETLMGISLLRWWTLRSAKGDILEVSAGTGRNLQYYRFQGLSSLTLTDPSVNMLEEAYEKTLLRPQEAPVTVCQSSVESLCRCASTTGERAEETMPRAGCRIQPCSAEVLARKYDTVVDTFGLCSHNDPVEALRQMERACKPGGRIILIEHGRSSWDWINNALDGSAASHYSKWGCWWNRDIGEIVREAGLRVESIRRWHFGTTYVIEAVAGGGNAE